MTQLATDAARANSVPEAGASVAFDRLAASYDSTFTESLIGRAQRNVVWNALKRTFRAGDRVLELNCGTGEDAILLAGRGVSVVACDASDGMIEVARRRKAKQAPNGDVEFQLLRNEELGRLSDEAGFDGALSNFSGLNCVVYPRGVAEELGRLVRVGGTAVICVSTRVCLWEVAWHAAHANFGKALRRISGKTVARLDGVAVPVWYPTIREWRRAFRPWFRIRSVRAVGLFVPPSYVEKFARSHAGLLGAAEKLDLVFAAWPVLRGIGDHVLLELQRTRA
jgi:ubiquinone/menaquinone biosynthesis C-methylase UbiE